MLIVIVPGYLVLYYGFQLYTPKRVQGRRLEAWHIIQANVIGSDGIYFTVICVEAACIFKGNIFVFSW